jgi:hypothetical protein
MLFIAALPVRRTRVAAPPSGGGSGSRATAPPASDWPSTPLSAAGQLTLAWLAPTLMGDGETAASGSISYNVYIGQTRSQVALGPLGSGTTLRTKGVGVLSHNEGSLASGTWFACVTSVVNGEESAESPVIQFTVT